MPFDRTSNIEIINYLKKVLGKYEKVEGIKVFPTFTDHVFKPEVDVSNTDITEIPVGAFIVKLTAKNADIKINLDRPISPDEYVIIPQDTGKTIMRLTSKIYAQSLAPGGKLIIEGLKLAEV